MTVTIEPLADDDVGSLCSLAAKIWREHYPPIIGAAQTEYMLAQRYAPAIVRAELTQPALWWDVLRESRRIVAFASSFPAGSAREMKLDKLYVHPGHQRHGYGGMLLTHVCGRARRLGYDKVILAVNKRNGSAIAAYRKHGFEIREALVKDIGRGFVMDDYIMEKALAACAPQAANVAS